MVQAVGWLIAGVLVLGIVLVVAEANEDNGLVAAILDVGRFFADPFRGIFELDDNKLQIAVNWSIAAGVYALLGILLSGALHALARRMPGGGTAGAASSR